jgi:hypothetical protein
MTNLDIAPQRRGTTQEIGGQEVVLAYADVNAEYDALRTNAIVIDRSHRGRIRFFGEKSGEALTGLVTNDVLDTASTAPPCLPRDASSQIYGSSQAPVRTSSTHRRALGRTGWRW